MGVGGDAVSGRHQPEHGADSAEGLGDLADQLATFLVASSFLEALTCGACSEPAVKGNYCAGHARLFEYTDRERFGEIAANE